MAPATPPTGLTESESLASHGFYSTGRALQATTIASHLTFTAAWSINGRATGLGAHIVDAFI